jgi:hypothetical protein
VKSPYAQIPNPRLNVILQAHQQGQYQGEGASALRDLRDAEGVVRTTQDPSTTSKVTVGRQWLEQALKDVGDLTDALTAAEAENDRLGSYVDQYAEFLAESARNLAASETEVENLKAQLDKIPRWIQRIFR